MIWPTTGIGYRYLLYFGLASILVLVLVTYNNNTVLAAPTVKDSNLKVSTVVTGLSSPTSMAFLGPDDILVLEKNTGLVKRIKNGVMLPGSLLDLSVASDSERGLLGIDVTNAGTPTQFNVFLYFTPASSDGGTAIANRLSKYSLVIDPAIGGPQARMTFSSTLLSLPVTPGPNHDGGKVIIGPDSNVYVVIGDLNRQTQTQNFETGPAPDGSGGILRVTQDGNTAGTGIIGSTNPADKYFAYGVRNSFGLDFDPMTNKLWDSENGASSNDEINLAEPGFNSGWKDLMGIAPSGFNFNNLVNFGGKGIYRNPEFVWTQVVAPTALEFFTSSNLGSNYKNDLFVGDYNHGRIYDFNLNSARTGLDLAGSLADKVANTDTETQGVIFGEGFGGVSDLKVGPGNGYLYVLSYSNGAIYKITGPDTTSPTVVSTNPVSGATGVPVSSSVAATFSEAVQATTVTNSTFNVKNDAGTGIKGSITLSPDSKTATFKPTSSLASSTVFTATVTNGIKDLAGNPLTPKSWSFTTAAQAGDTTPPTIIGTNPAAGATGVGINSFITATFSEVIQKSTVNLNTFTLKNSAGTTISGAAYASSDGRVAIFGPSSPLASSTTYTATVTTGVKDLAGNTLASNKVWSFTTAAQAGDTTPPTVTTTSPASGATGVAVTSSVTATFSEAVQSATVTTSTFTLKNSAGTSITGTVSLSGNTATFKPSSSLAYSTSYTAALTNGIKDLAGNLLTPKSWSFTTAPPPTSSCDSNLAISAATASGSQSTFVPTNAIDNNLNTKWWSTFIVNPWIRADLGSAHAICSASIAWTDGTSRQYSFIVSVSTDGTSFTNVFSGKSSGTTASPEKYSFAESQARYVKITVTQSHVGSASSIAQISEIDMFGRTGTTSTSSSFHTSSSSQIGSSQPESQGDSTHSKALTRTENNSISNHPPIAKADRISMEKNKLVLIPILSNDIDPDGDSLKVISASSHSTNGGTVIVNSNGTVTFSPSIDFVGSDSFSYTISDGKGKSDKAKVSITVEPIQADQIDKTNKQIKATKSQQNPTQEEKLRLKNPFVKNQLNGLIPESTQNLGANNHTLVNNR